MPKKVRVNPNQRVDLEDFDRASSGYTDESLQKGYEELWLSGSPAVSTGFRVEIPDQTTNAGQFSVYNGLGITRDGVVLNNEEQINDSRTAVCSGLSETFYIEVEYAEAASDVDSRAFWDPTFSGNTPKGKEFSLNVATRTTPDWKIVTPIRSGAAGFEQNVDPTSTRIPVAVLHTSATGAIDSVTLVGAASLLAQDTPAGSTTLKLLDTRIFDDTGTITLGVQTGASGSSEFGVTYTANNRETNTLTLAAPTTSNKDAGDRVFQTGSLATLYVKESQDATPAGYGDHRPVLFKANELRGAALSYDKHATGGRDDLDTKSIKDYVDFISAQLRELKFGHLRSDKSNTAPPSDFSSTRYYDAAGSVTGARTATITIGDGSTSWGDFNNSDVSLAVISAHTALPSTGGTIYVKAGAYTWGNTVIFSKPIHLIYDQGAYWTAGTYDGVGNFPFLTGGYKYKITNWPDMLPAGENCYITINDASSSDITLEGCILGATIFNTNAKDVTFTARGCTFNSGTANACSVSGIPAADLNYILFDDCSFITDDPTNSCISIIDSGGSGGINFVNCYVFNEQGPTVRVMAATGSTSFNNCTFVSGNTSVSSPQQMITVTGSASQEGAVKFINSKVSIGTSTLRAVPTTNPVIELGGTGSTIATAGFVEVDGLDIFAAWMDDVINYNYVSPVLLWGSNSDTANIYKRIRFDLNSYSGAVTFGAGGGIASVIQLGSGNGTSVSVAESITLENLGQSTSSTTSRPLSVGDYWKVSDVNITHSGSSGGGNWASALYIGSNSSVSDVTISNCAEFNYTSAFILMNGDRSSLSNVYVSGDVPDPTTTGGEVLRINGDYCSVSNFRLAKGSATVTGGIIEVFGSYCNISDCVLTVAGEASNTYNIISLQAPWAKVSSCYCESNSPSGIDYLINIDSGATFSSVIGCTVHNIGAGAAQIINSASGIDLGNIEV